MSDLKKAAQEALNALLRVQPQVRGAIPVQDVEEAIDALRAALAEQDAAREGQSDGMHRSAMLEPPQ